MAAETKNWIKHSLNSLRDHKFVHHSLEQGWSVLNTDGSKTASRAGYGGIPRNSEGDLILALAGQCEDGPNQLLSSERIPLKVSDLWLGEGLLAFGKCLVRLLRAPKALLSIPYRHHFLVE
ncbi:hypothetical protein QJS04_geneDACA009929 [Acorus gramineus]|uniref:Uncharacterized protein n=1 Tax=Acorus gramineus TaxID=55184 RepID=A0AAV9BFE7_ACOGR|nr:hypothetical protein QJS04_geneDACA009929 [Acorus gramineus]